MEIHKDAYFCLHFETRRDADGLSTLPALCLAQSLEGLRRTVHLVAMMNEKFLVKERVRVSREIEDIFELHCEMPKRGSFCQPTFIAPRGQLLFPPDEQTIKAARVTKSILAAMMNESGSAFYDAIPDSVYLTPIFASLKKMFDATGYRLLLSVKDKDDNLIVDSVSANRMLERIKRDQRELQSPDVQSVLTGYFSRVDFKESKLSLHLPASGRLINCFYNASVEQELLENPGELIQVVGTIELDESGNPQKVTDVQEVHPVSMDDIDLVDLLPDYLKPREVNSLPISLEISDDKQLYFARFERLRIDLAAHTRSELIEMIETNLECLWRNIAQEDDRNLWPKAQQLKKELHDLFEEM